MSPRAFLIALVLASLFPVSAFCSEEPVTVAYFYTVKWGYQQEFLRLFAKNHYPVLAEQVKTGRILEIKTFEPTFHGDGRADWTFLVMLTFRNWSELSNKTVEPEIKRRLFPDQVAFEREEQRRFEILEAHWDVALKSAPMR